MSKRSSIKLRLRKIRRGGAVLETGLLVAGIAIVIVATATAVGSAIAALIETL